jgi:histidine triad (HIT) family protein
MIGSVPSMTSLSRTGRQRRSLAHRAARWLFALARTPLGGRIVRRWFGTASRWLPVQRLYATDTLLAFYHPRPSYPVHVLIVPKASIAGLETLQGHETALYADLVKAVQAMVGQLGLAERGYRLIINGWAYQDVPLLHAHLISETELP